MTSESSLLSFLILTGPLNPIDIPPFEIDYLVICSFSRDLSQVLSLFNANQIIITGSLSRKERRELSEVIENLGIPHYDIANSGAYISY
jgi:hypothetical protein